MNKHGLFQKGVSPSLEMRAKFALAQRRRWAEHNRELDEFIAKVQRLIDDCYRQMGVSRAIPNPTVVRPSNGHYSEAAVSTSHKDNRKHYRH